ncbi:threonine/homoserine/homoserine lactone efflux protein [Sinorhizobium medicae]|uniref:Lysine transporter LysE n=1 Tax=Sinorhizobium medicae TaxID=110321 RepID=A0A508X0C7_9HYPH|nr:LysE family translocator [Sinorhizobium medicae]TWA23867.1 threonine/homoserine/homoserine lactone efflux protein [Sinorhizobium medicae]TWA47661.1 threonine/homoserine/homoserine lactone efflux protein [Sinorhizobium medicae]TWA55503.1 threonine/homoserine/homoserine lactone efflux protein [Sinorhizobium medicae]VTZ62947.1 Lysine transporter LysE [Sinorhizobium medicae]
MAIPVRATPFLSPGHFTRKRAPPPQSGFPRQWFAVQLHPSGGTIITLAALLAYSGALFIAGIIPGPGVTALVARALGSGFRETFFMGLGLIVGDMVYLTAVILGLAFVAQTFTTAFLLVKLGGAFYLGYIAWKLWTAGLLSQNIAARKSTSATLSFLAGLAVTLGNPKTMLFYVALVPTLIDLASIEVRDYSLLLVATFLVLLAVLLPYMLLATRARSLLREPQALKVLNRAAAGILAGTAAYIATRAT